MTTTTTGSATVTVETLTAEVRVLMVGNRQITLSVAKQLDIVPTAELEPFGRINTGQKYWWETRCDHEIIEIIGRSTETGALATSFALVLGWVDDEPRLEEHRVTVDDYYARYAKLPLIVLAGLR